MTAEITISKGGKTVIVGTITVTENFSNRLVFIRPAQSKQKQENGPKTVKIADLLIITHSILINGAITGTSGKTAKQVKDDLKSIFNGAAISGGTPQITYAGDTFNMFIEKMTIIEEAQDEPSSLTEDIIKYRVAITLVEGVTI